jgi:hypothetical protein
VHSRIKDERKELIKQRRKEEQEKQMKDTIFWEMGSRYRIFNIKDLLHMINHTPVLLFTLRHTCTASKNVFYKEIILLVSVYHSLLSFKFQFLGSGQRVSNQNLLLVTDQNSGTHNQNQNFPLPRHDLGDVTLL